MASRFGSKIQLAILIGIVLVMSACASVKTGDSGNSAAVVSNKTDDTTRTTIVKGKFENPPEIQQSSPKKVSESDKYVSDSSPNSSRSTKANATRISQKEALVNVRSTPSTKSKSVAVLKAGQPIEVLETRDSWAKITWQQGDAVKMGWTKKAFVEGY
jgi:uncharacterized protein YgiM (DUF1202 family)